MRIGQLEYLAAVARLGSYRKTAEALDISLRHGAASLALAAGDGTSPVSRRSNRKAARGIEIVGRSLFLLPAAPNHGVPASAIQAACRAIAGALP